MNPHTFLIDGVPDNSLDWNVLLANSKYEGKFRPGRKGIRVEDKNALQT